MSKMQELFDAGRRVSAPLFAVSTADQSSAIETLASVVDPSLPVFVWDSQNGITPFNEEAKRTMPTLEWDSSDTYAFNEAARRALTLPFGSALFMRNAHRYLQSAEPMMTAANVQSLMNVRDPYKKDHRSITLVGPLVPLPVELSQDVVILRHELPTTDELTQMVNELIDRPDLPLIERATVERAVEAVSGLNSFAAEQAISIALREDVGIDIDRLWEQKLENIDQGRGTRAWRGGETFADVIGLEGIKANLNLRKRARRKIRVIVWVDEVDKTFANAEEDRGNNVRMNQIKRVLEDSENYEWEGMVALGPPGTGKSLLPKALGNELGVPIVAADFGGMQSKYVGESEAFTEHFLALVKALAGDGIAYFVMTSNNASAMRPELQRRMTDGVWFFDMPNKAERDATWAYYLTKYGIDPTQPRPDDDGWTPAEIRNCARKAWMVGISLIEAAKFIMPMSRSRADEVENLRRYAHGRLLDAAKGGFYNYTPDAMKKSVRSIVIPKVASLDRKGGNA